MNCKRPKLVLISLVVGFVVTAIGLLSFFGSNILLQSIISKSLQIVPGTRSYENWEKIPLGIVNKIYLFNISNIEEVINGSIPHIQEVGPFVYEEKRQKHDIKYNHDKTQVTYRQNRTWFFRPELSKGSLDDIIFHLNVPVISAVEVVRRWPNADEVDFLYYNVNEIIQLTGSVLYPNHTVRELLFEGYVDPMIDQVKGVMPIPYDKFGWFYPKNQSSTDGLFTIFTGVDDSDKLGLVSSWLSNENTKYEDQCGSSFSQVSAGDLQPPALNDPMSSIKLFVGEICRPLKLNLRGTVDHFGIETYRYSVDQTLFDYFLDDNKCFCPVNESCPLNGVANVSSCVYNSTAAISLPHFLYADQKFTSDVKGMKPDLNNHLFYMDVLKDLGIPLEVKVAMQINMVLNGDERFDILKDLKVKDLYMPMIYFTAEASLDESMASQLKTVLKLPQITYYVSIAITLIGIVLFSGALYFVGRKSYNELKNSTSETSVHTASM